MLESQGWIKVHRKILENPLFTNPDAFMLWMQLLLRANHKEAKVMIGNSVVQIKRGQSLTGRKALAKHCGLTESKIERLLKLLEIEQQIEQQTFTKYRLISITNYDKYQSTEQQSDNNRTTTEQQSDTNKNDNNGKNEKEVTPYQLIADSYNQNFAVKSGNSQIAKLTDARKKLISKAWKYDTDNNNEKLRTNSLDYFNRYFNHCSGIKFFQADCPRTGEHENWSPNFDFILSEKTQTGVREGKYK